MAERENPRNNIQKRIKFKKAGEKLNSRKYEMAEEAKLISWKIIYMKINELEYLKRLWKKRENNKCADYKMSTKYEKVKKKKKMMKRLL